MSNNIDLEAKVVMLEQTGGKKGEKAFTPKKGGKSGKPWRIFKKKWCIRSTSQMRDTKNNMHSGNLFILLPFLFYEKEV